MEHHSLKRNPSALKGSSYHYPIIQIKGYINCFSKHKHKYIYIERERETQITLTLQQILKSESSTPDHSHKYSLSPGMINQNLDL